MRTKSAKAKKKYDVAVKVSRLISLEDLEDMKLKDGTLRDDAEWKITFTGKDGKAHSFITKCMPILLRCNLNELSGLVDIQSVIVEQLDNGS